MATKKKTTAPKKSAVKKTTVKKTAAKKVAKRRKIPADERMTNSRFGKTYSAHQLGLNRTNDRKLFEFVNRNKKALKELPKNDAINLMKQHCSYPEDMRRVKNSMITKTELHKIINE